MTSKLKRVKTYNNPNTMRNGRETDGYRDYDFDYENDIGEVRYR